MNNLFIASMEQIISSQSGGISFGHCKSGKDRKGVEIIHTDAMLMYFNKFDKFPKDQDDEEFVKIFTEHFVSNHQQINAENNAIGCCGLKSLKGILSDKLLKRLGAEIDKNDLNAGINRPKYKGVKKYQAKLSSWNPIKRSNARKKHKTLSMKTEIDAFQSSKQTQKTIPSGQKKKQVQQILRGRKGEHAHAAKASLDSSVQTIKTKKHLVQSLKALAKKGVVKEGSIKNTVGDDFDICEFAVHGDANTREIRVKDREIEMVTFDEKAMKVSIAMMIETHGDKVKLEFGGLDATQIKKCDEIRKEIIASRTRNRIG